MTRRYASVLFWSAAALVAVSLGSAAGPVAWRLAGEDGTLVPAGGGVAEAGDGTSARTDLAPILALAPFGRAVTETAVEQVVGETSLGLLLLGVTIASTDSRSRAMIAHAGAAPESFGIGSEVAPQTTLVRIEADHVVLRIGDRLETLSFATSATASARTGGGPNLMRLIPTAATATAAPPQETPDAVIARYRAQIQMNAQGVLNTLGLVPTEAGYVIADSAAPGVRQAGFRPGDVVTTVNGRKVGNVDSDRSYFDEVAASGRARVELLRDGQTIVMSFPLR